MDDNTVNPLLNPLVIKEVYKYLDFPNKKSFRLVCKPWIDTILDLWRKQTKLVIVIKDNDRSNRPKTADFTLKYFDLYKIAEKPLQNLKVVNMEMEELSFNKNARISFIQTVHNLLAKHFGHSLERLELVKYSFLHEGEFAAGLYHFLVKSFPKLKVLSVRWLNITSSIRERAKLTLDRTLFPSTQSNLITLNLPSVDLKQETAKRILNLIPNLKNLSLLVQSCSVLEAMKFPLSSSGNHILLEGLGINTRSSKSLILRIPDWIKNYVEAARPPLKSLKACIPFGLFPRVVERIQFPVEPFIYKPIWICVENTLTSIDLFIWTGMWSWCTLFSGYSLPKLTDLCLNFREVKHDVVELLHFDFGMLRGTPLLQKLHLAFKTRLIRRIPEVGTNLEEHELEWSGKAKYGLRGPIVLDHLKDFRFELYHKPTEICWRAFAEMMPNLRKLQGMVDEDTEPLVMQLWPDLNLTRSTLIEERNDLMENGIRETEEGTISFLEENWPDMDYYDKQYRMYEYD